MCYRVCHTSAMLVSCSGLGLQGSLWIVCLVVRSGTCQNKGAEAGTKLDTCHGIACVSASRLVIVLQWRGLFTALFAGTACFSWSAGCHWPPQDEDCQGGTRAQVSAITAGLGVCE